MTQSTGQYLIELLKSYGVDTVFGIPGVHTIELYRGLAGKGLRHISPRHEQGAGFMADGYARVTGRPGVCFVISGPGVTNIATAMGQAYGDSIPMLVISTVNAHGRMGSGEGWLHEMPDQRALINGVCAFSRTVNCPEELAPALAQAFAVFDGARPRPVNIELPINVMLASAEHLTVPRLQPRVTRPIPTKLALTAAADMLASSRAPVILLGGGAVRADIANLAEALDAPVVMTVNARGLLPPSHKLGVSLSPSLPATRSLVSQADVVLAIGTELGPTDYDFKEDGGFAIQGQLIRADIDPVQIMRGPPPTLTLVGDAAQICLALAELVSPRRIDTGAERAAAAMKGIAELPDLIRGDLYLLTLIRDALPGVIFVGDSTQLVYAGCIGFVAPSPSSWFCSATGFGTLGYGLPAAIGTALGSNGRPVVALVGDGGLQFSLAELASATEAKVPIILMLHDNKGYGEIKTAMVAAGVPTLGVDILTPDIDTIAIACGWHVVRVDRLANLTGALTSAKANGGAVMVIFNDNLREEAASKS